MLSDVEPSMPFEVPVSCCPDAKRVEGCRLHEKVYNGFCNFDALRVPVVLHHASLTRQRNIGSLAGSLSHWVAACQNLVGDKNGQAFKKTYAPTNANS